MGADSRNFEAQNGILAANMVFASRRDLDRVHNQVAYGFERKPGSYGHIRGNLVEKFWKIPKNGSEKGRFWGEFTQF